MSRRSALHNRYKKDGAPKGTTRKSAASAKPSRDAGKGAGSSGSGKPSPKKSPYMRAMPDTPEFKRLRKIWWIVLGVAIVMLLVSLLLTWGPVASVLGVRTAQAASLGLSWLALGLVAYSWWIDLKKIRPMIKEHEKQVKSESKKGMKK